MCKVLKSSIEGIKDSFELDGTEIYGQDGQTVYDIEGLALGEIIEILEIKKDGIKPSKQLIKNPNSLYQIERKYTMEEKHIKKLEEAIMDLRSIDVPNSWDSYIDSAIRLLTGILKEVKETKNEN
ncbi:hypothetical protein SAMN05444401_3579 [Clostridium amylolyticum]|uniref:Uncharacterized protein n=1 Tax=Clostridium amylolyticum TaxID=1121298 RepID=A0A1M6L1Z1_9CLOT|nr:hypothetical protein [Clostridium amylolyticum]SHJ65240.1 hypothetical protein SAMN05444401_3579 [Clostridium amylolyticum]